jgi:hypothetical protein
VGNITCTGSITTSSLYASGNVSVNSTLYCSGISPNGNNQIMISTGSQNLHLGLNCNKLTATGDIVMNYSSSSSNVYVCNGNFGVSTGSIYCPSGNMYCNSIISSSNVQTNQIQPNGNSSISLSTLSDPQHLYLNDSKGSTSGDIHMNTGSNNSNVYIDNGSLNISSGNLNSASGNLNIPAGNLNVTGNVYCNWITPTLGIQTNQIQPHNNATLSVSTLNDPQHLYLNDSKGSTSGDIHMNYGSTNSNVYIDNGSLNISAGNLNITNGNLNISGGNLNLNNSNMNINSGSLYCPTIYLSSSLETNQIQPNGNSTLSMSTYSNAQNLYLNNGKGSTSGDIHMNYGSTNSNVYIDNGGLIAGNSTFSNVTISGNLSIIPQSLFTLGSPATGSLYCDTIQPNGNNPISLSTYSNAQHLYLNDLKGSTSGDIHMNYSSTNSNVIIDSGNLSLNNGAVVVNSTGTMMYGSYNNLNLRSFSNFAGIYYNGGNGNCPLYVENLSNTAYGVYLAYNSNSWVSVSDSRLKTNLVNLTGCLEGISGINSYTFNKLTNKTGPGDDGISHIGFIAQEVQAVYPQLIDVGDDGFLGVKYAEVTAVLAGAVNELNAIVKQQAVLIAQLQSQISQLMNVTT